VIKIFSLITNATKGLAALICPPSNHRLFSLLPIHHFLNHHTSWIELNCFLSYVQLFSYTLPTRFFIFGTCSACAHTRDQRFAKGFLLIPPCIQPIKKRLDACKSENCILYISRHHAHSSNVIQSWPGSDLDGPLLLNIALATHALPRLMDRRIRGHLHTTSAAQEMDMSMGSFINSSIYFGSYTTIYGRTQSRCFSWLSCP
jgi:hypothetical protein